MFNWLGRSSDQTSSELRQFKIDSIISVLRKQGVKSLGDAWLIRMTDKELNKKYDEIVNEV